MDFPWGGTIFHLGGDKTRYSLCLLEGPTRPHPAHRPSSQGTRPAHRQSSQAPAARGRQAIDGSQGPRLAHRRSSQAPPAHGRQRSSILEVRAAPG